MAGAAEPVVKVGCCAILAVVKRRLGLVLKSSNDQT
jgi:hypothetical protein